MISRKLGGVEFNLPKMCVRGVLRRDHKFPCRNAGDPGHPCIAWKRIPALAGNSRRYLIKIYYYLHDNS